MFLLHGNQNAMNAALSVPQPYFFLCHKPVVIIYSLRKPNNVIRHMPNQVLLRMNNPRSFGPQIFVWFPR